MTARAKLRIVPGATFRRRIAWKAGGQPVNLTGFTAAFEARDVMGQPVLSLTSGAGGGIVLGGTAGTIDLYAPHTATAGLSGTGAHHLHLVEANGDHRDLLCGPADYAPCTAGAIEDGTLVIDEREVVTVLTEGTQGPAGVGGGSAALPSPVMADAVPGAGWPIAIDRSNARGRIARGDTYIRAFVVGLSKLAVAADEAVDLAADVLTLTDWTGPAGTALLSPGLPYFLSPGGGIAASPPPAIGGHCNVVIGYAINANTLEIRLSQPLLM